MNKVTELVQYQQQEKKSGGFSLKQIEILKNTICQGVTNDEFEVFLMTCQKTQLDPFLKQIHAVKRKDKMTIQTGIDGYRLIAERTHCYAPGPEPTFTFKPDGSLDCATAYVKKLTKDGTWHTIAATAYLDEYGQTYTDRQTGQKKCMGLWGNMPKTMLSKCAEAVALRRAFPGEMSNVYTQEEMMQADSNNDAVTISLEQASELSIILENCDPKYKDWAMKRLKKEYNIDNICFVPLSIYEDLKTASVKNMHAYQHVEVSEVL